MENVEKIFYFITYPNVKQQKHYDHPLLSNSASGIPVFRWHRSR